MNWISVKDRLPELEFESACSKESKSYLIWDVEYGWNIARYVFSKESNEYYWEQGCDFMKYDCEITHWLDKVEGPNENSRAD